MENERKKCKVGIITLYHGNYNFGGLLQAYALPAALKKYFDVSAEQISFCFPTYENTTKEKITIERIIYKFGIAFFNAFVKNNLKKRKKAFDRFMEETPHSCRIYYCDNIFESVGRYNTFICGGDQIWNDWKDNRFIEAYTLQFVPPDLKKIAYAPSMAILETSANYREVMGRGLDGLDAVSVREKKSLPVLTPLTDNNIEVVVDPVLLLKDSEWADVAILPKNKKKYILCYILGDSTEQRKSVEKLSKQLGLKVLTFPHILANAVRKCDLFFGDIHDYTSGPREFVGLIKNAELVITDSFHACVFSMIFKTPFAVFERNKPGEKGNMNSRIYDFLEEYHLENRLVTEAELSEMKVLPKIDYTYAHEHLKKRREESLAYLEKALSDD